jgi:Xaa-Pro aminopeptidase
LYDVVLAAHDAAIDAARPGATFDSLHQAARDVLLAGLAAQGLITAAQRDDQAALKQFFPHRTSHWLGLEVHDVGAYARADGPLLLQPGMVLTVEPGLYLGGRSIGIRIEDDVLITSDGCEVLTGLLPASADAIESLLQ